MSHRRFHKLKRSPKPEPVKLMSLNFTNTELAEMVVGAIKQQGPIKTWFPKLVASIIAKYLTQFTDDEWNEMCREAKIPCGVPNCDCEDFLLDQWKSLDKLRTDCQVKTGIVG